MWREKAGPIYPGSTEGETREEDCEGLAERQEETQGTRVTEAKTGPSEGSSPQALRRERGSDEDSWWHGGHGRLGWEQNLLPPERWNPSVSTHKRRFRVAE